MLNHSDSDHDSGSDNGNNNNTYNCTRNHDYDENIIYSIICLKSVDVRTMQFVFLAHSPREMSQTDRIHPMYFLLRVRVSIRPRYFVNAKKP